MKMNKEVAVVKAVVTNNDICELHAPIAARTWGRADGSVTLKVTRKRHERDGVRSQVAVVVLRTIRTVAAMRKGSATVDLRAVAATVIKIGLHVLHKKSRIKRLFLWGEAHD